MIQFVDKKNIIMLKEQGLSNREVARRTGGIGTQYRNTGASTVSNCTGCPNRERT